MTYTLKGTEKHKNGETIYNYVGNDGEQVSMFMHPTKAWNFCFPSTGGLSNKELDKIVEAFISAGIEQHERGGFDNSIKTLEC